MTFRQIGYVLEGESRRIEAESRMANNLAAYQAWRTAQFMRMKRMPDKPDDLLKVARRRGGTGEDWQRQKATIEMLNAALGGTDARKRDGAGKD